MVILCGTHEKAKLYYDRREKALEKTIPEQTLQNYNEHYQLCNHKFGDEDCPFREDKVYFQWRRLHEKKETPVKDKRKGKKRGQKRENPRVTRKKLRLSGNAYQTTSGKIVKAATKLEYVACKCH